MIFLYCSYVFFFFFKQKTAYEMRISDGVQTCALPISLGPRLDLRQSQQLVMTPQLQQAIKLLALTNLEIEAFVTEELECNPLLEVQTEDDRDRKSTRLNSSH